MNSYIVKLTYFGKTLNENKKPISEFTQYEQEAQDGFEAVNYVLLERSARKDLMKVEVNRLH
ncbi:MAG: hypothetical protein ACRDFB_00770 [Rhabdochlamydiaceae bacterium]